MKVEAANTTVTKKNFADSDLLFIPKVFWDQTAVNVLTIEEIDGIGCTDIAAMDALNIDRKALAENGVKFFLIRSLEIISFMLICILGIFLLVKRTLHVQAI